MDLKFARQCLLTDIISKKIDLFVCAENHELRSYTLYEKLAINNQIDTTLVLCYKEEISSCNKEGVSKIKLSSHKEIFDLLDQYLKDINNEHPIIVVDYSCMTKSWYYSIILYLKNKNLDPNDITIYFSYTPSKFYTPLDPKPNTQIGPLPGKYVVPTDKPKALIVCLGYEHTKAEGIIEHLDPKASYLIYTKPGVDRKFVRFIEENNKTILDERLDDVITYPFNDLTAIERQLTGLYFKLKDEYSVIIAPLGPKPFTFVSMLMSIKYNDIDIWRVGSGYNINEYPNEPIDDKSFIICETHFEK